MRRVNGFQCKGEGTELVVESISVCVWYGTGSILRKGDVKTGWVAECLRVVNCK